MNIPTKEEILKADKFQLCEWWRFCPAPITKLEHVCMHVLAKRYKEMGGCSGISKQVGWDPR
jgi:hypothetical protein